MNPLAIVIPWFGQDLKGGAETQAWQIASRLAQRGHEVEVLTTCCRSPSDDWSTNHLPEGLTRERDGFTIRRFPVQRQRQRAFRRVCEHLHGLPKATLRAGVSPLNAADATTFSRESIKSTALLDYLRNNAEAYHAYIFMPYLYGPVLNGLPIVVTNNAYLQPCLHNETYAYLPQVTAVFHRAKGILFNSEGEFELAVRLYGPSIIPKSVVVGEGVEVPEKTQEETATQAGGILSDNPFVLCLGRKERGKNSHLLLEAFRAFRNSFPASKMKLVFAGLGSLPLDDLHGQVVDMGVVSDQDKVKLLDGCRALFQPSENESFSRVMMEAWRRGRPVAAHRDCLATATAVRRCGGGWLAGNAAEWSELFASVEHAADSKLAATGAAGLAYARNVADWQKVMDRYETALFGAADCCVHVSLESKRAVHQVLPNLTHGDAISNFARWIRRTLQTHGIVSEIFVRYIDKRVATECRPFTPECVGANDVLLYHHSIGSELTPHVIAHTGRKCLIYHNITPAEFYEPFQPKFAALLRQGREDLKGLAAHFPLTASASAYNAAELREFGFTEIRVLPLCVDPTKWDSFDPVLAARLQNGQNNILFVGRLSPNKKQDDLLHLFRRYLDFDPNAILHLVGSSDEGDPYRAHLENVMHQLGIGNRVNITGSVTEEQLATYYQFAHLFWSASEHEGFCVPLIEAMWFDVPVLAFKSSAIPETLSAASLMFTTKHPMDEPSALAWLLIHNDELRRKVITAQRRRRADFLPPAVTPPLLMLTRCLLNGTEATTP